jgi:hypothetical protein
MWPNDGVRVLNMRKKALPMTAKVIKYVLKYQNSDDERDWKIKQLLRVST